MKYTGNVCPGCQNAFCDDDDIVVCPECGTPQHRECYNKENRCVNSQNHGTDFQWQGIVNNRPVFEKEKKQTVPCPNCGIENPIGSTECRNCSMKFTLFGMNVVDAIAKEQENQANPNKNIPDYAPPFTLGVGEGFEPKESEQIAATPEQVENLITGILSGEGEVPADGRINLGGPFPLNDEIDGARTNTIGNFIGTNAMAYISKFKKIQSGKKFSFNFAAFFLSPYWFFFRKLYKAGIVFLTAFLALSILFVNPINNFLEFTQSLSSYSGTELTQAQFDALILQMTELMMPVSVYVFLTLMLKFICGFCANPLYKKYVTENASIAERCKSKNSAMAYIIKYGGASFGAAVIAYAAQMALSFLASFLIY